MLDDWPLDFRNRYAQLLKKSIFSSPKQECVLFNTDQFLVESAVYPAPVEPGGSTQFAAEPPHMDDLGPANRQTLSTWPTEENRTCFRCFARGNYNLMLYCYPVARRTELKVNVPVYMCKINKSLYYVYIKFPITSLTKGKFHSEILFWYYK